MSTSRSSNRGTVPCLRRLLAAGAIVLCTAPGVTNAQPVQWAGNGHWYEYVPAPSIFQSVTFAAAKTAAESRTYLGLTGYLATITSASEQSFINGAGFPFLFDFGATSSAWLGGSDGAVEGEWRWVGGPESGQLASYTNWCCGHPVNGADGLGAFDYLYLFVNARSVGTVSYGWASAPATDGALGYLVEYGPAPTPPTSKQKYF